MPLVRLGHLPHIHRQPGREAPHGRRKGFPQGHPLFRDNIMRAILAASLLVLAGPAFADQTTGTVAAYDAATNQLTFTDNTVWYLPASVTMPASIQPGDAVAITYVTNSDNGWGKILTVLRTEARPGTGG